MTEARHPVISVIYRWREVTVGWSFPMQCLLKTRFSHPLVFIKLKVIFALRYYFPLVFTCVPQYRDVDLSLMCRPSVTDIAHRLVQGRQFIKLLSCPATHVQPLMSSLSCPATVVVSRPPRAVVTSHKMSSYPSLITAILWPWAVLSKSFKLRQLKATLFECLVFAVANFMAASLHVTARDTDIASSSTPMGRTEHLRLVRTLRSPFTNVNSQGTRTARTRR